MCPDHFRALRIAKTGKVFWASFFLPSFQKFVHRYFTSLSVAAQQLIKIKITIEVKCHFWLWKMHYPSQVTPHIRTHHHTTPHHTTPHHTTQHLRPRGDFHEQKVLRNLNSRPFYLSPLNDIDENIWHQGCFKSKSCIKPKLNVSGLPFKFCFMQDHLIPNYYFANL